VQREFALETHLGQPENAHDKVAASGKQENSLLTFKAGINVAVLPENFSGNTAITQRIFTVSRMKV